MALGYFTHRAKGEARENGENAPVEILRSQGDTTKKTAGKGGENYTLFIITAGGLQAEFLDAIAEGVP